jgi:Family of unknown function (DUF5947)
VAVARAFLSGNWVSRLRHFVSPPVALEHCEFCHAPISPQHPHLIEPAARRLVCACPDCAETEASRAGSPYRPIPRETRTLRDFAISEAQWNAFQIPIGLVFLFIDSTAGRPVALYPGAAGATQSLLGLDAWAELAASNPMLNDLQPDVEALLINRTNGAQEYYLVPIDRCYWLAGLIRSHWRGLSGGSLVWDNIGAYFAGLRDEAAGAGSANRHG